MPFGFEVVKQLHFELLAISGLITHGQQERRIDVQKCRNVLLKKE